MYAGVLATPESARTGPAMHALRQRVGGRRSISTYLFRRCLSSSSASSEADRTTHFGFSTVPEYDKERLVGNVFKNVASNYDIMNDVMSGGIHRVWKDTMVEMLGIPSINGAANLQVLDVAGGTGDIAFRIAREMAQAAESASDEKGEESPRIVVSDINPSMLTEGQRRLEGLPSLSSPSAPRMEWLTADARKLPFDDCTFDVYTIAFGIRNVTRIDEALKEAHRVLRPGGRFLCLEFSHVTNPLLAKVYDAYSFNVIPRMGELVASDRASYQYLVESIRQFPKQEHFAGMMREAGMRSVTYTNLTFGTVAIHSGFRLSE